MRSERSISILFFVSVNGSGFTPFIERSSENSAEFVGENGKTYEFICIATDTAGNVEVQDPIAEATTTIVLDEPIDTTAPVITPPSDITVEAEGPSGRPTTNPVIAAFLAEASAMDDVDGNVPVTNDAPSVFPLNVTKVTFSATDNAGNTGSASAEVNVTDTTAPVVTPPSDITVKSDGPSGTPATNPVIAAFLVGASAVDDVDGNIPVTNDAPLVFPLGVTEVTFSATDGAGNTGNATANVTVEEMPKPMIEGDLDDDEDVDEEDRNILRAVLGSCNGEDRFIRVADFDDDGCITQSDYRIWYGHYKDFLGNSP